MPIDNYIFNTANFVMIISNDFFSVAGVHVHSIQEEFKERVQSKIKYIVLDYSTMGMAYQHY